MEIVHHVPKSEQPQHAVAVIGRGNAVVAGLIVKKGHSRGILHVSQTITRHPAASFHQIHQTPVKPLLPFVWPYPIEMHLRHNGIRHRGETFLLATFRQPPHQFLHKLLVAFCGQCGRQHPEQLVVPVIFSGTDFRMAVFVQAPHLANHVQTPDFHVRQRPVGETELGRRVELVVRIGRRKGFAFVYRLAVQQQVDVFQTCCIRPVASNRNTEHH